LAARLAENLRDILQAELLAARGAIETRHDESDLVQRGHMSKLEAVDFIIAEDARAPSQA
jgi:hypothetical protein